MATILRGCISHRSICHLWLISYQEKLALKASNEIDSPNQFLTLFGSSLAQRHSGMLCWWPGAKYLNQLYSLNYFLMSKYFSLNGEDIRLMLWDTAGQECFRSITKIFYRGAHVVILAYSLIAGMTFENLTDWLKEVR